MSVLFDLLVHSMFLWTSSCCAVDRFSPRALVSSVDQMSSRLRCPNKAKHILITCVIFQSSHEQRTVLLSCFFPSCALNSWMCIQSHENGCPAVQRWLSTVSRLHQTLLYCELLSSYGGAGGMCLSGCHRNIVVRSCSAICCKWDRFKRFAHFCSL